MSLPSDLLESLFRSMSALSAQAEISERRARHMAFQEDPFIYDPPKGQGHNFPPGPDYHEIQMCLDAVRDEYRQEYLAATPICLFRAMVQDEFDWLAVNKPLVGTHTPGTRASKMAYCSLIIQQRWEDQGVWQDEWPDVAPGNAWAHEGYRILQAIEEFVTEAVAAVTPPSMTSDGSEDFDDAPVTYITRRRSESEMKLLAGIQAIDAIEAESSRPHIMFANCLANEKERMLFERAAAGSEDEDTEESRNALNMRAFARVKATWVRWRIWNDKWGCMPGLTWKHEHPIDELFAGHDVLLLLREHEFIIAMRDEVLREKAERIKIARARERRLQAQQARAEKARAEEAARAARSRRSASVCPGCRRSCPACRRSCPR